MQVRVADLCRLLGGELLGDGDTLIARIGSLLAADEHTLCFVAQPRYASALAASAAGCVIVGPQLREAVLGRHSAVVCANPYVAYARLTQWWVRHARPAPQPGVHPSAVVEEGARIDPTASIAALAYVGAGAQLAAGVVVGTHVHIGADASIGQGTVLKSHVVFGAACRMGARGILYSGAVVGADGFGHAPADGHWEKIEQLGSVVIGDDVELGANTCVDRGALDDTVLEDGVKIDNLVQIAHNVRIGAHTAFAGCAGVAGSARIGRHCTIGGAAIVLGHLEIVDHVHVTAGTVISRSIRKPGQYSGSFPFDDNASWEKNAATLRQLYALRERLRALERKN